MNIVVAGCGKIGGSVLANLVAEGHDVVALDTDESVISDLMNKYDVMGVCGNGADCETLTEAGIEKAELFIATTGSDELNMLSCYIARKMGAQYTIARIRNPEYNDKSLSFLRQQLGLSLSINPELLAAQELFNVLKLPSAAKIETFSRNFEMIELKIKEGSPLDGMKLCDFPNTFKSKVLIGAVQRGENVFIPDGNFVIKSGDRIGISGIRSEIIKTLKALSLLQKQAKNIMILGASKTAYYLSKMLINNGSNVKIIEKNRDVCRDFCESLPKAVIINGDGAKQDMLLEEGLKDHDAFVALTGMDEENILISIFAILQGVPKVISKINRNELSSMAEKLGMDSSVSPKDIISDVIVRYARAVQNSLGSNIETMYKLMDGQVEALEFNVKSECRFLDIPLKNLKLKKNVLIAEIIRDRKPVTPSGDDVIKAGDRVIVFATADRRLQDFSDIIK